MKLRDVAASVVAASASKDPKVLTHATVTAVGVEGTGPAGEVATTLRREGLPVWEVNRSNLAVHGLSGQIRSLGRFLRCLIGTGLREQVDS